MTEGLYLTLTIISSVILSDQLKLSSASHLVIAACARAALVFVDLLRVAIKSNRKTHAENTCAKD